MHFKIDILTIQSDINTPNSKLEIFSRIFNGLEFSYKQRQMRKCNLLAKYFFGFCLWTIYIETMPFARLKSALLQVQVHISHLEYPFSIHFIYTHTTLTRYRHFVTIFTPPHYLIFRNKWNDLRINCLRNSKCRLGNWKWNANTFLSWQREIEIKRWTFHNDIWNNNNNKTF